MLSEVDGVNQMGADDFRAGSREGGEIICNPLEQRV
jgi:hypothetical protein